MLGRVRRTTRTDITLALVMAGVVYLAYALSLYTARTCAASAVQFPPAQSSFSQAFLATMKSPLPDVLDILGPVWLVATLYLVIRASRQRRIISWSWLLICIQAIGAIILLSWAALSISGFSIADPLDSPAAVSWSPRLVASAVIIWVGTLTWLVIDGRRLQRGPTLSDGVKTMLYRR